MIRKISIGPDPFKAMHYILEQTVLDKSWVISTIILKEGKYIIWIQKEGEEIMWKSFNENLPIQVEYNIDYNEISS